MSEISKIDRIADSLRVWKGQPVSVWVEDVAASAPVVNVFDLRLVQIDQAPEDEIEADVDLVAILRGDSGQVTLFFEEQTLHHVSADPSDLYIEGHRLNVWLSRLDMN